MRLRIRTSGVSGALVASSIALAATGLAACGSSAKKSSPPTSSSTAATTAPGGSTTTTTTASSPIPVGTTLLEFGNQKPEIWAVDAQGNRLKKLVTAFADEVVGGAQLDPDGQSIWYLEFKGGVSVVWRPRAFELGDEQA